MSFIIDWSVLTSGPEADQLKSFINEEFSKIKRPNFLGALFVSEFSFGTIPPEIAIVNISDPLEEFYFEYDYEETNSGENSNQNDFESDDFSKLNVKPKGDYDAQLELSIEYKGDLKIVICTELIINQPTDNFMTLPLKLTLTKTSLKANAVLAYMGNHINFCLREPEGSDSILRDLSIESEIGDNDRQVLKNVGKIEKFIVQQLTTVLDDYLVFPNFHSICFEEEN